MNKYLKPLYSIYPRIQCAGIIFVNDVPVVEWLGNETQEGGYGGDILINNVLLQSGKYQVIGKMYPRFNTLSITNEENMSIDFYLSDVDNWKDSRYKFHPKIEAPWDGLSKDINYKTFEITTAVEVELPFVLNGWQNSVNLNTINKKELFKETLHYYKQIHKTLTEHNVSDFLKLSSEKMQLQEEAFYYTEDRKKSFQSGIVELFNQGLNVVPLVDNELELQVMGHGKLVRLMKRDGNQPLQFKSPDIETQSNVKLEVKLHMRNESNGLSII